MTDESGNIKRLARSSITFTVLGEAELISTERMSSNPRLVEWGTAPAIIRTSLQAGEIRIQAKPSIEGLHSLIPDEPVLHSKPSTHQLLAKEQREWLVDEKELREKASQFALAKQKKITALEHMTFRLKGVEAQQAECGETTE